MPESDPFDALASEPPDDARRLLDNGWVVLLFRDGLGQVSALAARDPADVPAALEAWEDHEPADGVPIHQWPLDGPNRFCGCGLTTAEALHAVAEKVLLNRFPGGSPATESE